MQKAPAIFFHSVVWFQSVMFSVMETAGLVSSCVADVSGNVSSGRDFFLLTLKVLFLKEAQIALFHIGGALFADEYQDSLYPLKNEFYVPDFD